MPTLDPSLRDLLAAVIGKENADTGARLVAEAGAKAAIEALAVPLPSPYAHLDLAQKQLRNGLRARARQLGDARRADGRHEIGRLVEQTAYEHWHRMLFARFLAENDLLIHPEMGVAVTLDECAALAASEGAADGWELAGRFASRMLPQIFRPDDPLLAVRFAIDDVKRLEALLDRLPAELFRASDSLGWCYQFWQAKKKKQINASEVKIGADELPAVTQLFTEPYMVQFLLHNTLGAWWVGAGRELPFEMPYLRFLDDGTPAAGTFEGWPRLAAKLKVLDPCCGSGHFLVAAFEILVAFRVAEEGLTPREACDAVLRDNLFGLEIDARCVQIAAFALAMAAWSYPEAGGYRPLAPMNVACSGLAISAKKEEWERLGGDNQRLRNGMGRMWELFSDAPVLGSLIDPTRDPPDPLFAAGFDELGSLLGRALRADGPLTTPEYHEEVIAAQGVSQASVLLSMHYHLVATNVPYLGRVGQCDTLRNFAGSYFPDAKSDLATVMLARIFGFLERGGSQALVTAQNWWTLASYKNFRRTVLRERRLVLGVSLGEEAWVSFGQRGPRACLMVIGRDAPAGQSQTMALEAHSPTTIAGKVALLLGGDLAMLEQELQLRNPDARILLGRATTGASLKDYADSFLGLGTGDYARFGRRFWEFAEERGGWTFHQGSPSTGSAPWAGLEDVIAWDDSERRVRGMNDQERARIHNQDQSGQQAWGKAGVAVSLMRELRVSPYTGYPYDKAIAVLLPKEPSHLPAIWAYCNDPEYTRCVRELDQSVIIPNGTLVKVPFDLARWQRVAEATWADGLPKRHSTDPTQWVFASSPRASDAPLQVAVARLLGYRWPDQQPDALDAHVDADGIVCIPAMRGERPAADRLADLLAAAWGPPRPQGASAESDWHPQTLTDLLAAVGHAGTLEEWLRDAFFKQHCELFHHRPFVWHVWDGHREGFAALVNYHTFDHEGLKALTYSYLGDWIRTQEIEAKAGKSGAGDKVAKAKALQQRLAAILEGEAPLDVFVRWKPIEQQPIGWHPDLDDGVRLNLRPFLTVADVGAKGAGVLRWKPNIKWGTDRGKNPPGAPWGDDRDNDRHLTLAEKRAARGE